MQHAGKMVLILAERYTQNKQDNPNPPFVKPAKSVQTPGDKLSRLDQEMSMILNSSLQDVEKWKNYEQVLRRYLFILQKPSISVNIVK